MARFANVKPTYVRFTVGDLAGCVCTTQPVGDPAIPRAALLFSAQINVPMLTFCVAKVSKEVPCTSFTSHGAQRCVWDG